MQGESGWNKCSHPVLPDETQPAWTYTHSYSQHHSITPANIPLCSGPCSTQPSTPAHTEVLPVVTLCQPAWKTYSIMTPRVANIRQLWFKSQLTPRQIMCHRRQFLSGVISYNTVDDFCFTVSPRVHKYPLFSYFLLCHFQLRAGSSPPL